MKRLFCAFALVSMLILSYGCKKEPTPTPDPTPTPTPTPDPTPDPSVTDFVADGYLFGLASDKTPIASSISVMETTYDTYALCLLREDSSFYRISYYDEFDATFTSEDESVAKVHKIHKASNEMYAFIGEGVGTTKIHIVINTKPAEGAEAELIVDKTVSVTVTEYAITEGKVLVNGTDLVDIESGKLKDVITAAGTVTSLEFGKCNLDEDDVTAFKDIRSTIVSLDLSKVTFKSNGTSKYIGYTGGAAGLSIIDGSLPEELILNMNALETVILPDDITALGARNISDCKVLTKVVIPDAVKSMGRYCVNSLNALKEVPVPSALESVSESYCVLPAVEEIVIPEKIKATDLKGSFRTMSSLKKATIATSATFDKTCGLLEGCSAIEKIELASTCKLKLIDDTYILSEDGHTLLFYMKSKLTASSKLPAVQNYGREVFYGVSVELTVPEGVEYLAYGAFRSFHANLTLPSTINNIQDFACNLLSTELTIKATTPPTLSTYSFGSGTISIKKVTVPAGCGSTYKSNWSSVASVIVESTEF